MKNYKTVLLFSLILLTSLGLAPNSARADVPTPPTPPPPPSGYCSTIYSELSGDLEAFNILLTVPPLWKPIAGGPTVFAANLQQADGNVGPSLSGSYYMAGVLTQLQELKATGVKGIAIQVGFPVLYEPFYGSQANMQPYVNFYSQVAQAVKSAGLKLIVENDVLLSNDVEAGWTNLPSFYSSLSWTEYMAARATMAATVASTMQPDYLVLSEEPDSEANQTGQPNMNTPADAAQMISGEITAVRALKLPTKLGAGFGNWLGTTGINSLVNYITSYVALPLDYIDFHLYPINTEAVASLIDNTLVIASMAAAAGKPVAMSEGWAWKMENSEFGVMTGQDFRARDPFSFFAPIDAQFLQTLQALAKYTNMLYAAPESPDQLFVYQTYGGTTANGGASNCTCTTTSCSDYDIVHTQTSLASTANSVAQFSTTGLGYLADLVSPADKTAPATPSNFQGTASYNQTTISWNASSDNVGVAGYNVYRCSPATQGGSCTGVWLANSTATSYTDMGLAQNTPYNYQVQAFDLSNNNSAMSTVLNLQTFKSAPTAPSNVIATVISDQQINLTWSAPQKAQGLSKYLVYAGTSPSTLVQVGSTAAGVTSFHVTGLIGNTAYYLGVAAVESGVTSVKSPLAWATTYPQPTAPSNVSATATGTTTIALAWQENTVHGGLTVTSYQILRGTSAGSLSKVATVTGTSYTDKSLTPGKTYYYEIVAVDSANDTSPVSSEVSATTT